MTYGTLYTLITGRSSRWPKLRNAWLKEHPCCVACGQDAATVHHIAPVHAYPELELDRGNLASVCDRCHFTVGHANDWRKWVDDFESIACLIQLSIREKINIPDSGQI